jgi:hypothetical protein
MEFQNSLAQGLNAALQRQNSKFHKLVAGCWLLVTGCWLMFGSWLQKTRN